MKNINCSYFSKALWFGMMTNAFLASALPVLAGGGGAAASTETNDQDTPSPPSKRVKVTDDNSSVGEAVSSAPPSDPPSDLTSQGNTLVQCDSLAQMFHLMSNNVAPRICCSLTKADEIDLTEPINHNTTLELLGINSCLVDTLTIKRKPAFEIGSLTALQTLKVMCLREGAIDFLSGLAAGFLMKPGAMSTLILTHNNIGDEGVAILVGSLHRRRPRRLDLAYNKIGDGGAQLLASFLENNTSLQTLRLEKNKLQIEGVCAITRALCRNTTLEELDLSHNMFSLSCISGSWNFQNMLKKNSTLRALFLNKCYNTKYEGPRLVTGLWFPRNAQGGSQISGMRVVQYEESYKDNHINLFAEGLARNSGIQVLSLEENYISCANMKYIAAALESEKNTTLTTLILRDNEIGADGMKELAQALKKNKTLTMLDISWNAMGDQGAGAIADLLEENKVLKYLDAEVCAFTDEGRGYIIDALVRNTTMTHVNLWNDGDEGWEQQVSDLQQRRPGLEKWEGFYTQPSNQ